MAEKMFGAPVKVEETPMFGAPVEDQQEDQNVPQEK